MKIYIIPAWYPQNEQDITACFFREQAHALADRGHDITVIHIEPISVTRIGRSPFHEKRVWQDENVRTIYHKVIVPIPGKLDDLQEAYISERYHQIICAQILEDEKIGLCKPDLLHAHVSHSCAFYCLNASKKLGIPLVVTEHYSGLLLGEATPREYRRVHDTIEHADAFIFVGSNFQKTITKKLKTTKKTYVIPNMLPSSMAQQCDAIQERGERHIFTFLTACHLKKNKRVDLVIRAFHQAFEHDETVQLMIAGDGEERIHLENLVHELKEKRIHFVGQYSREDSARLFSSADIFVLTSQVETFGIVYLEAMLQGVPCIGTKGQGAEDIIDESNGQLVEYGDIDLLARSMIELKSNYASFNHYNISKSCVERFSQKRVSSQLIECYEKLIMGGVIPLYKRTFTFLTACHLKKHKSVDVVIQAFHEAFGCQENVHLVIAGDGDELALLKQLCVTLKENRVVFLGRYTREDAKEIFSQADGFVLTSQVEPFGIVYIEALCAGLPCIGTKGQGADDMINEDHGFLVEYGNQQALVDAMRKMVAVQWDRGKISRDCRERFSGVRVCSELESLYVRLKEK